MGGGPSENGAMRGRRASALFVALGLAIGLVACDRSTPAGPGQAAGSPQGGNMPQHDEWCGRELDPRFVSQLPCQLDSDCLICLCEPINRVELARRGGSDSCLSETREECTVTNALCCGGRCVGVE